MGLLPYTYALYRLDHLVCLLGRQKILMLHLEPLFQKPPYHLQESLKFESQYRQVILKLIAGHLSPVVVPFNFLVFDKRLKNVVAQCFANQFTLIS